MTFVFSQKLISRLAIQNFAINTYSTNQSAWSQGRFGGQVGHVCLHGLWGILSSIKFIVYIAAQCEPSVWLKNRMPHTRQFVDTILLPYPQYHSTHLPWTKQSDLYCTVQHQNQLTNFQIHSSNPYSLPPSRPFINSIWTWKVV